MFPIEVKEFIASSETMEQRKLCNCIPKERTAPENQGAGREGINFFFLGGRGEWGVFPNNKEKKELKLNMISRNFSFRRKLIGVKNLG